jgi:hypothetical protein
MYFPGQLLERFASLFQRTTIFFQSLSKTSYKRFNFGKIPRRHPRFHLFYPRNKRKFWKLYHSTDIVFLSSVKNLVRFLSNFYKFYAPKEWDKVRLKIPVQLGLFGTIFTSIACDLDTVSWHLDPGDLEFAVILYVGKWERVALLFGLQETPVKLVVGNMDIVFIKSAKKFHVVENLLETEKLWHFMHTA